ncbi:HD family hydrolase [Candidatus Undinarchaeota archaeon]
MVQINIEKILRLKETKRTGWVEANIDSPESVADHSYSVSLLSVIIADLLKDEIEVDMRKISLGSLLHDLGEAETGDVVAKNVEELERERNGIEKILESFPLKEEYLEIWDEHLNDSVEGTIIKAADNLDMLIQARDYKKKGASNPKIDEIAESAQRNLGKCIKKIPALEKVLELLDNG